MPAETLDYLGVRLTRLTALEMIDEIKLREAQQRTLTVSCLCFHVVNIIRANKNIERFFRSLDVVTPGGIAILWTSWLFGRPLTRRNQLDIEALAPLLYTEAVGRGWGIYFLGGAPGIASVAADKLREAFPGLRVVGTHHGYLNSLEENQAVIDEINRSGATIVLVGMGQPLQEEWMVANKPRVRAAALIAVGAYFSHVIRHVHCYPAWVYKWRVHWLYRLLREPRRLWKRYTLGFLTFCMRILWGRVVGTR